MNTAPELDQHFAATIAAAVLAAVSFVVSGFADVVSQVAPNASADAVAPWLSGGASLAAVGCLAYIARQFANGSIVAQNTAQLHADSAQREDELAAKLAEAHQREVEFLAYLREARRQ